MTDDLGPIEARCDHCTQTRVVWLYDTLHDFHLDAGAATCRWCTRTRQPLLCTPCWSAERLREETAHPELRANADALRRICAANARLAARSTTADQWNATHPVGTPVHAWPGSRDDKPIATHTRTPAWTLGHGAAVVSVEGYAGGIRLAHIEPRDHTHQHRSDMDDDTPTGQHYPCQIGVYCDDCGFTRTGDYLVSDLMTKDERLSVARNWLVRNENWQCDADGDYCPAHARPTEVTPERRATAPSSDDEDSAADAEQAAADWRFQDRHDQH
jgi:hypothetical protein